MPYAFEKQKKLIPREYDRRVKLSDFQKEEIKHLYSTGKFSYRSLAREYGVTKNTIRDSIYPEKAIEDRAKKLKNAKEKNYYYDAKKNTENVRKHRQYKKLLDDNNLLLCPKKVN